MSFIGDAIGDVFGGITGAKQAGKAAEAAGRTQAAAAQAGIEEQRRQFDKYVELMSPYVQAGTGALTQQQALLGLGTPDAQQQAIAALESSPQFQALQQQGETAILQNAAATGGLRGGNVQSALAQFRPALLSSLIEQQYSRLGGLSTLGQASAAGQGAQAGTLGANVANLLGQQGAARAGGIMGQQQAFGGVPAAFGFGQTSGTNPFAGGLSGLQAGFSGTSLGGSGFGSGLAYGNADLGTFF